MPCVMYFGKNKNHYLLRKTTELTFSIIGVDRIKVNEKSLRPPGVSHLNSSFWKNTSTAFTFFKTQMLNIYHIHSTPKTKSQLNQTLQLRGLCKIVITAQTGDPPACAHIPSSNIMQLYTFIGSWHCEKFTFRTPINPIPT